MRRPRVAAALILAIALTGAIVVAVSSSGGPADVPRLGWESPPVVVPAANLPSDAIVTGRVRNNTLRELELEADDLVVVDDRGRRWRTSGRYMQGFAHGLWPPGGRVANRSDGERERLGEITKLKPGESAPLTVAWSKPPGGGRPVRIELGGPELTIPRPRPGV